MTNLQIFNLFPLISLFLYLWGVESEMISLKLAQSICSQAAEFKASGKIQIPIKTFPSKSESGSGSSPHKSRRKKCSWFRWIKLEPSEFVLIPCSSRDPGMTGHNGGKGKGNTRVAWGEEIGRDEFPSFGRLYQYFLKNSSNPDDWDKTLMDGRTFLICGATLISEYWAVTGINLHYSSKKKTFSNSVTT